MSEPDGNSPTEEAASPETATGTGNANNSDPTGTNPRRSNNPPRRPHVQGNTF